MPTDATATPCPTAPVLFQVWCRPGRGHRWRKLGSFSTRAEAVNACKGSGDFWIAEPRTPALAAGLFEDPPAQPQPAKCCSRD